MFLFRKIKDLFYGAPKTREEIIVDNLKLPFTSLILKYDYFIDPKDFLSQDNISTTLPNGNKLIAYDGYLKVLNKIYPLLPGGITNMIAVSNEEIITTGTFFVEEIL